jgi:hypothetical protein
VYTVFKHTHLNKQRRGNFKWLHSLHHTVPHLCSYNIIATYNCILQWQSFDVADILPKIQMCWCKMWNSFAWDIIHSATLHLQKPTNQPNVTSHYYKFIWIIKTLYGYTFSTHCCLFIFICTFRCPYKGTLEEKNHTHTHTESGVPW